MNAIFDNIRSTAEKIGTICSRLGRDPREIEIVAVAKTKPPALVEAAIQAGIRIIGENRVQEAARKKAAVRQPAQWHLIGHLQTNKVRKALQLFDLIQSVDSLHLAEKLDGESEKRQQITPVLIQVNTSGEASKFGIDPEAALDFVGQLVSRCPHVKILGLMTIGLFSDEAARIAPCFAKLRKLSEDISSKLHGRLEMKYLSMGMSGDYEIALQEGANMLRLGRVLFGERN